MSNNKIMSSIIIIPARLESTRLPNKPLAMINDRPMIIHCCDRAKEADFAPVLVAAGNQEICDVAHDYGYQAVLTDNGLPSGSDRIYQALLRTGMADHHDVIINMQGDLPDLLPDYLRKLNDMLLQKTDNWHADIATLASLLPPDEVGNHDIVKIMAGINETQRRGLALAFSRAPMPYLRDHKAGENGLAGGGFVPFLHHIGLYAWRKSALARFVNLPPSLLEKHERLEQLRALEDGMRILVELVDKTPISVDTKDGLETARETLA